MRSIVAFVSAVALVLVIAMPAAAQGHQQSVPLKMHLVGADQPLNMSPGFPFERSTFGGRCAVPSDWVTTIDSAGTAAHLGNVSMTQSHCTQIDITSPLNPAVVMDGRVTVVAANGDELWMTYTGSFIFTPTTGPDVGISNITYAMTIVGGTGRFAHASGSVDGTAVDYFPDGPNTADYIGVIWYDASDRSSN